MAITARASGSWAEVTDDASVAIPAAQVSGDLVLVLATWKDYSVTAEVSGYTEIAEWADGVVDAGANVGSMKVGAWYKVATSDTESDPTIDFSAGVIGAAVVVVFQKSAGEQWSAPTYTTAAISPAASPWSVTGAANLNLVAGDCVVELVGIRDDSSTFTRNATTALAATGITWSGNYTEYPATHFSTTNGFDCSADAGYRIASSGTSSAAPTATGTLSASETGALLFIRLRVSTATSANAGVASATGAANADTAKIKTGQLGVGAATGAAQSAVGRPGILPAAGYSAITAAAMAATAQTVDGAVSFNAGYAAAIAAAGAGHGNISAGLGFAQARTLP